MVSFLESLALFGAILHKYLLVLTYDGIVMYCTSIHLVYYQCSHYTLVFDALSSSVDDLVISLIPH